MGTGALSPGVKRPGREADHPPSNAEGMNGGAIPPHPHIITVLLLLDDFPTGTSLSQREMLLFTQGLTGVFRQAGETSDAHSIHTCR
jgi:hypothetical protein